MRSGPTAVLGVCALALAVSAARADIEAKGPVMLRYTRGPGECLPETEFRREVAIAGDGVDRFDPAGPAVLRVWFEKLPDGRFRGTLQYTNADGETEAPRAETYGNCEVLARGVGTLAYYYQPDRPFKGLADPTSSKALANVAPKGPAEPAAPNGPADPVSNQARADAAARAPATWPPPSQPPAPRSPPSFCSRIGNLLRDMDLTIALSGLVLVTAGYTDNAGPGFGIGVDVRGEQLSFGLELRGVLPSRVYAREQLKPIEARPTVELDVGQLSALFIPCVRFAKYFAGCGVLQVGVLTQNDVRDLSFRPIFSFGPRFAVEVPFAERFAIFGFGEALIVGYGASQSYAKHVGDPETPGVVWKQSPVSAFFGAGLVVKFQ